MDVLWKTKPRLVVEEISRLKEEEGRSNTDFELRTTASKNVIGRMSQEELNELQEAAKDMEQNGHSEDHKRRWATIVDDPRMNIELTLYYRLAKRYHKKRVYETMHNQFREMGMTSVVLVCYKDFDGKPVVNWYVRSSIFS